MTPVMSRPLAAFKNEVVLDFSQPGNLSAAQAALKRVRAEFDREYDLWVAGESHKTGDLLVSTNPAKPSEIVGRHHRATKELANRATEAHWTSTSLFILQLLL